MTDDKQVDKSDAPRSERVEQRAVDLSPENLPATTGAVETIGARKGMFGVSGTGDTSGYGGLNKPTTFPAAAQRPYGGWFDVVANGLDGLIDKVVIHRGEITFHIAPKNLPEAARKLRDDESLRFELCSGVSGVHYPDDLGRELHAVYHLLSMTWNRRVRLEVAVSETDPHIPSLVATYPTADWHERETWDFFGIIFDGHPALTRIQMPDDWPGHPQRKDYPLGGVPVEYKGASVPPPDQRRSYN